MQLGKLHHACSQVVTGDTLHKYKYKDIGVQTKLEVLCVCVFKMNSNCCLIVNPQCTSDILENGVHVLAKAYN